MTSIATLYPNLPLTWRHEDGREGYEVSEIPSEGMVYFYDVLGPVFKLADIQAAKWMGFITTRQQRLRVTRLLDREGVFHYIVPGAGAFSCREPEHHDCEPGQCTAAVQAAYTQVNKEPIP